MLRILDMFLQIDFISHVRIFRLTELTIARLKTDFFEIGYFKSQRNSEKNSNY